MKYCQLLNIWPKSIMFKTTCDCNDSDDDITVEMEYNKDENLTEVLLHFQAYYHDSDYVKYTSEKYQNRHLLYKFKVVLSRIKNSLILLFTGHLKYHGHFTFKNEDHLRDFIRHLEDGVNFTSSSLHDKSKEELIKIIINSQFDIE